MSSLAADIDSLASLICARTGDPTVMGTARLLAQFMLVTPRINRSAAMTYDEAVRVCQASNLAAVMKRALASQSDLAAAVTPRSIGVDMCAYISSGLIQSALDVKQVKKTTAQADVRVTQRIVPIIKIDILYSHPTTAWIRFHGDRHTTEQFAEMFPQCDVMPVEPNIHELYCRTKDPTTLYGIINRLDRALGCNVLFCSELSIFYYNSLVFLSNFIKFMWCYRTKQNAFMPTTYPEIKDLVVLSLHGMVFLMTNNLSNMPSETHGPLIACSGERPKVALGKFESRRVYSNEGSRAMQALGFSSDFGTISNHVNVTSEVELTDHDLDSII